MQQQQASGNLLLVCFYASGAAALVDQVVWARQLVPVIGAATPAVTMVLAAFMGGLAMGGLLAGPWIDDRPNLAIRAYATLEILTALVALSLPGAFGVLSSTSWPLVGAFLLLLIPTTLMGATLPILARVTTVRQDEVGSSIANLYAANTTGAMTGCLAAGYITVPLLGLMGSLKVAAGLNLVAAALAWYAARALKADGPPDLPEEEEEKRPWLGLATALFGLCGALGLAFEVLWTRALITYLSNSVYAFSAMLFVFLGGLALGGILIGNVCDRLSDPIRALALVVAGIGLSGLVARQTVLLLPRMLELGASALPSFSAYMLLQVAMAALILLPQTVLLGCTFPLVARLVTGRLDGLGKAVGRAYFCNTVGGILGSLMAGFALIPRLGVQGSIVVLCLLAVLAGGGLLIRLGARRQALLVSLTAVGLILLVRPWDAHLLLRGADSQAALEKGMASTSMGEWEPIYVKEGQNATVVVGERAGQRTISVNGQLQASSLPEDRFTQESLGHLPMLFAPPNSRSVLVIGMGTGMTSAAVARHAPQSLRLAEMEPAVLAAGALFEQWNAPLWKLPGFRPTLIDGRVLAARADETFDVITSDPIHPLESAASPLYTVEHFRNCRRRLTEGGIMCQWLPLYGLSEDDSRRVMGSFVEVFPEASLWCYYPMRNKGDSILLGTRDGTPLSVEHLEGRLAMLKAQGVTTWSSPAAVLGGFVMGGERLREYSGGLLHTDDRPVLEFSAPRSGYLWTEQRYLSDLAAVIDGGGDDLPDFTPPKGLWMAQAVRGFEAMGRESKARRLEWMMAYQKH